MIDFSYVFIPNLKTNWLIKCKLQLIFTDSLLILLTGNKYYSQLLLEIYFFLLITFFFIINCIFDCVIDFIDLYWLLSNGYWLTIFTFIDRYWAEKSIKKYVWALILNNIL